MPDWICPTEVTRIDQPYRPETGHYGVDVGAWEGDPLVAPADGVVVWVGNQPGGAGLHININHDGVQTRMFHMSRIDVEQGQQVAQGQTVGAVGSTGGVTGPHLHYEMRGLPFLEPFDPAPYLTPWFAPGVPVGAVLPDLPDPEVVIATQEGDESMTSCTGKDGTFVFVTGYDEAVWVNHRDPMGQWSGWASLGGIVRDPVEVNASRTP